MLVHKWLSNPASLIPGLAQEYYHPASRPYPADWIVASLAHDAPNRCYWVEGQHRESGKSFFWGIADDRPLSWRYDLQHAEYAIGRHETDIETRKRENAERLLACA